MRQRSRWFMVPAIVAISSHCLAAAGGATGSAESSATQAEQQVRDAIADWVSTYNRNDWQALGAHFTENAVMPVREADGQWRLSHDAFNSDIAPRAPLADRCPAEITGT